MAGRHMFPSSEIEASEAAVTFSIAASGFDAHLEAPNESYGSPLRARLVLQPVSPVDDVAEWLSLACALRLTTTLIPTVMPTQLGEEYCTMVERTSAQFLTQPFAVPYVVGSGMNATVCYDLELHASLATHGATSTPFELRVDVMAPPLSARLGSSQRAERCDFERAGSLGLFLFTQAAVPAGSWSLFRQVMVSRPLQLQRLSSSLVALRADGTLSGALQLAAQNLGTRPILIHCVRVCAPMDLDYDEGTSVAAATTTTSTPAVTVSGAGSGVSTSTGGVGTPTAALSRASTDKSAAALDDSPPHRQQSSNKASPPGKGSPPYSEASVAGLAASAPPAPPTMRSRASSASAPLAGVTPGAPSLRSSSGKPIATPATLRASSPPPLPTSTVSGMGAATLPDIATDPPPFLLAGDHPLPRVLPPGGACELRVYSALGSDLLVSIEWSESDQPPAAPAAPTARTTPAAHAHMVAQFAVGAPTRAVDSDTSPFDVRIVPSAPDAEIDTEIVLGQPFAATCTVTNTAAIETFFDLDLHLPPTSAHGGRRADEAAVAQSAAGLLCLVDCVHVGTLGPGESARVPIELLAVSGPGVLTEVLDVAIAEGGADGGARFEVGVQVGVRVALSIADGETRVRAKTIGERADVAQGAIWLVPISEG